MHKICFILENTISDRFLALGPKEMCIFMSYSFLDRKLKKIIETNQTSNYKHALLKWRQ